ncbi:MAG TPA: hypothetical protein VLJ61_15990 [Pyrinomonadaceae bacterium]|nr:hypothetical protein [Pyrinomonadaceae bacterium]
MTKVRSRLDPARAPLARALSCLLLSTLVFSATVGVLHRHAPERQRRAPVANTTGINSVAPSDGGGSQSEDPLQSKDCSICQLQRSLSGALLYGPVFMPAPAARQAFELVASIPYLSATATPRRGRAPPSTSL